MARRCDDCNAAMRVAGSGPYGEDYVEYCPHCAGSVGDDGQCDCSNCRVKVEVVELSEGQTAKLKLLDGPVDEIQCGAVIS